MSNSNHSVTSREYKLMLNADRFKDRDQGSQVFLGLIDFLISTAVKTVNDFKAAEVVRKLCKFQFGEPPTIKASLSFWYLTEDENDWPLVGEFSFDYDEPHGGTGGDRLETYPSQVVEGAKRFFGALQSQAGWLDFNGTTKTAFALEVL